MVHILTSRRTMIYVVTDGYLSDYSLCGVFEGPADIDLPAILAEYAKEFPEQARSRGDDDCEGINHTQLWRTSRYSIFRKPALATMYVLTADLDSPLPEW